jgi:hypothetical protein
VWKTIIIRAGNNLNDFISSYNNIIVDHEKKKIDFFENINEKLEKEDCNGGLTEGELQVTLNWIRTGIRTGIRT